MRSIACLILYVAHAAISQQVATQYYTRADGLTSDYIFSLYQDRDGFLWIGTDRGVNKFDGITFHTLTTADGLPSNLVYTIFQSSDGAMWFGTFRGGACRFDGKTFTEYPLKNTSNYNDVISISEDKFGRIYFRTLRGVCVLFRDSITTLLTDSARTSPLVKTTSGKFFFLDQSELNVITPSNDHKIDIQKITVPFSLTKNLFSGITNGHKEFADGDVWYPVTAGFLRFNSSVKDSSSIRIIRIRSYIPNGIGRDNSGRFWIASRHGLYSIRNKDTLVYGAAQGIDPSFLQALLVDHEGVIWLGSFGGGLIKMFGGHLSIYTDRDGLTSSNVHTTFEDSKGRMWIGNKKAGNMIDGNTVYPIRLPGGANAEQIRAFAELHDGSIIAGTFSQLVKLKKRVSDSSIEVTKLKNIAGVGGVSCMYVDSHNALWVGFYGGGVVTYFGNDSVYYKYPEHLPSGMIEKIVQGKNSLWFLSRDKGAARLKNGTFETFSTAANIPITTVYAVFESDSDGIFFGTDRGLVILNKEKARMLGSEDGLIGASVLGIFPRSTDSLWIMSDKALHVFSRNVLMPYSSFPILPAGKGSINEVSFNPSTKILVLATTSGAAKIDLNDAIPNTVAPKIFITSFKNEERRLLLEKKAVLNHTQNNLSITFRGISFSDVAGIRYRYRLHGAGTEWSSLIENPEVNFRNLPDGDYRFEVIAVNSTGVQSVAPARISFTITPPIWKRWWFIGMVMLAVIAAILFLARYIFSMKLRKQLEILEREKAINEERLSTRDKIARDLHDEVASTVGSAGLFIETAKRKLSEDSEQAKEYLNKTGSLLNEAEEAMSDIVWSVSPKHDTLQSLAARIKIVTTDLCRAHSIGCTIEMNSDGEAPLADELRRGIYLIFKEALNNCVKHADAKHVDVHIGITGSAIFLKVRDDGKGFLMDSNADTLGGNGMHNMRKRADEISAHIEITSAPGEGTAIILTKQLTQLSH